MCHAELPPRLASGDPSRAPPPASFLLFPVSCGMWGVRPRQSWGWLRLGWGADVRAQLDACPDVQAGGDAGGDGLPSRGLSGAPITPGTPAQVPALPQDVWSRVYTHTHACKGMHAPMFVPFHARICMDVCPCALPHLPGPAQLSGGAPNHGDPPVTLPAPASPGLQGGRSVPPRPRGPRDFLRRRRKPEVPLWPVPGRGGPGGAMAGTGG